MNKIIVKNLEFDISNSCGNTCQACYHNKIKNTQHTHLEKFKLYLDLFLEINKGNLHTFSLYGGNLLETKGLQDYLYIIDNYKSFAQEYVFSTTFGSYDQQAQANQNYLFSQFLKGKKFIFQYFFNPTYTLEYIKSCRDILKYFYPTHIFFSVQLISLDALYISDMMGNLKIFFTSIGIRDDDFYNKLKSKLLLAIKDSTRTEDFTYSLGTYTFFIMILSPVRKEKNKILSVCGRDCSFFTSMKMSEELLMLEMLSIEHDGYVNFHNPNCIASMQRIFHIEDSHDKIYKNLSSFYNFLLENRHKKTLLEKCNSCLTNNLTSKI